MPQAGPAFRLRITYVSVACLSAVFSKKAKRGALIVLISTAGGPTLTSSEQFGAAEPALQVLQWEDVFVVIDDGRGRASDYDVLVRGVLAEQASRYAIGLGCLVIIPVDAKPPSEPVREAIKASLAVVPLRCLCWLVEGAGFHAAMVRGVLTGLRLVVSRPYDTHVSRDLEEALRWMLPHLVGGTKRIETVSRAAAAIRTRRSGTVLVGS
jgi:hypothetical protein